MKCLHTRLGFFQSDIHRYGKAGLPSDLFFQPGGEIALCLEQDGVLCAAETGGRQIRHFKRQDSGLDFGQGMEKGY